MAAQPSSSVTRDAHLRVAVALEDWVFQPDLIALLPHADALCKALSAGQDSGLSRYTVCAFIGLRRSCFVPLLKSRAALRADVVWVWPLTYPWRHHGPSTWYEADLWWAADFGETAPLARCPTQHRTHR